jgi:tRNA A37 N6-isopentenylltransferase MiaA
VEHSIAAKYAARPAASFPRPSVRVRERRLGLGSAVAFRATSGRVSVLRRERAAAPLPAFLFGLRWARPVLAERIASRLGRQLRRGFLDEVRRLLAAGLPEDAPGPRTLGYRELLLHLRGECSLEEASERIALKTRQLAKRQETWFRLTPSVHWFDLRAEEDLARVAREIEDRLDHAADRP